MKKTRKKVGREIFSNISYNFISTIVSRIGGLIFIILIARILNPDSFGVYALSITVILFLITIADVGFNHTMVRYVSEYLGENSIAKARSVFRYLFKMRVYLILIFFILFILIAKSLALYVFKNPDLILPFQMSAIYFIVVMLADYLSFAFFALKGMKFYAFREVIFQIFKIIFAVLFAFFLAENFKVAGVFLGISIATLISLFYSFYVIRKNFKNLISGKIVEIDKKRILRYSFFIMLSVMPVVIFVYIDSIMLGIFLPIKYVGFYRAALTMATSVGALLAFHYALFPFFVEAKKKDFKVIFTKTFHFTALLAIPATFLLAFIGPPLIKILYGADYLQASLPLYFLSFLILDAALLTYFVVAFQVREMPEITMKIVVIATVLNVILNFILIRYFASISVELGMVGAAIATIISRSFYGITLGVLAKKILKISPRAASIYKPLIASIIMMAFLLWFSRTFGLVFPVSLLELVLAGIVYVIVMILIKGITKKDISYFKGLIKSSISNKSKI